MFSWLFAARRRDPRSGRASDTSDAERRTEGGGRYLGTFGYTDPYALTNKQIVVRLSNTGVELFDQLTQGVIQLSGPETFALADALVDHRSWLESGRRGPQPKAEIPVGAIVGQDAGVIHVYVFNGARVCEKSVVVKIMFSVAGLADDRFHRRREPLPKHSVSGAVGRLHR